MHFDLMGFLRILESGGPPVECIDGLFKSAHEGGGNLFIPSFSYSYTSSQDYTIRESKCTIGKVLDHLRKSNPHLRTSDPQFSYLAYSDWAPKKFFAPVDYATFGHASLMAEVYERDGLLISIGQQLHHSTEIHYLEKILSVPYRQDKDFSGVLVDLEGRRHPQVATYYCKDLGFFEKNKVKVGFSRMFQELDNAGLVHKTVVGGDVLIESVRFQSILPFIKKKLEGDLFYLMQPK